MSKKRKTNEEIKNILYKCFMKNNNIFNIKAIMKETGLMRETVVLHKDEVIKNIRDQSLLIDNIKSTHKTNNKQWFNYGKS
jgi:hypothetical protein